MRYATLDSKVFDERFSSREGFTKKVIPTNLGFYRHRFYYNGKEFNSFCKDNKTNEIVLANRWSGYLSRGNHYTEIARIAN